MEVTADWQRFRLVIHAVGSMESGSFNGTTYQCHVWHHVATGRTISQLVWQDITDEPAQVTTVAAQMLHKEN
jgi:hypothetical protein